jgi:hypothetical protein
VYGAGTAIGYAMNMTKRFALLLAVLVGVPLAASAATTLPGPIQVRSLPTSPPTAAPPGATVPFTCDMSAGSNVLTVVSGGVDQITFSVSKGPAADGLSPGQCAFEDRAIRSSEPTALCFSGAQEASMKYKGTTVTQGGFNTTSAGKLAQFLVFGVSPQIMNFTVQNLGGSCFNIVSYGVQ